MNKTEVEIIAPCLHCGERLEYRSPRGLEPFAVTKAGYRAWVHASTGAVYVGECRCGDLHHRYSHNAFGLLACPSWRDDHVATPRRS